MNADRFPAGTIVATSRDRLGVVVADNEDLPR